MCGLPCGVSRVGTLGGGYDKGLVPWASPLWGGGAAELRDRHSRRDVPTMLDWGPSSPSALCSYCEAGLSSPMYLGQLG